MTWPGMRPEVSVPWSWSKGWMAGWGLGLGMRFRVRLVSV